jgi:hypothetical protein
MTWARLLKRVFDIDIQHLAACDPACCAWAITPTASCPTTTRIDKKAAFFIAHLVLEPTSHIDRNCENDDLQQKGNGFVGNKKG